MAKYEDISDYNKLSNEDELDGPQKNKKKELEEANPSWANLDKGALEKEQQKIALESLIAFEKQGTALTEEENQRKERILRENETLRGKSLAQLQTQLASLTTPTEQKESKGVIIGDLNAEEVRKLVTSLFKDKYDVNKAVTQPKDQESVHVTMSFEDFEKMLGELAKQGKSFSATFKFKDENKPDIVYRCDDGKLSKSVQGTNKWNDMVNKTGPKSDSMKDKLTDMKKDGTPNPGTTLAPGGM